MSLNIEDIKNLERLSRLKVSEENRSQIISEVSSVLDYVGQINDLDLGTIDNSTIMHIHKNITRADTVSELGSSRDIILEDAPKTEGQYIKVTQVIKK